MKRILLLLALCLPLSLAAQQQADTTWRAHIHEFDFWLGAWDVYKYGTDTLVGLSSIETLVDSMVLYENYESLGYPYHGKSLNKYNPFTGKWEQFWVDNSGITLKISGNASENKMVMGNTPDEPGSRGHNRITWTDLGDGTVRQTWENSPDGKEWSVVFDGHYRPRG